MAQEPWAMFPYPLPMDTALVAALKCYQWKVQHEFPHTRGLLEVLQSQYKDTRYNDCMKQKVLNYRNCP